MKVQYSKPISFLTLALLTVCATHAQDINIDPATTDEGVIINGIKWATRNLAAHGKFVEKPEDYGALFQWGRAGDGHEQRTSPSYPNDNADFENGVVSGAENFDVNGQIVNTHAAYGKFIKQADNPFDWRIPQDDALWNLGSEATPIKMVNDPCPAGWRLPTYTEFATLDNGKWTNTPVFGYRFWNNDASIFFPAAGYRDCINGMVYDEGEDGYYWSNTAAGHSCYLSFGSDYFGIDGYFKTSGFSIRCVAEH
jgi:uncharacterized protein (TIGR02145 family)